MIRAAQAMVKCLEMEGIKVVFGYPGAAICPFYDELYRSDIKHVLVRHEANAGHAASGYARITNKPAVCIATSGPGATNLLTAIATAYADSIPLICITGQVSTDQIGCDVFQEVDITGAAEPFVKYSYLIKDAAELPRIFKEAFHLAGTGRKGPVLIDVPVDVQNTLIDFTYPETVKMRTYKPTVKGNPMQIKKLCEAIEGAERPLICAGGGVFLAGAEHELAAFAEKAQIPAVSTMMGLSLFPTDHPLYLGMLGMHGVKSANRAVNECDTMILIGARVGDRAVKSPTFLAENKKIIHIDIDPAEIGKNIPVDIPLVGDCKAILSELTEMITPCRRDSWLEELAEIKNAVPENEETNGYINPKMFLRKLSDKLPANTVCVADVGQNQIWCCNNFAIKEGGRFLTTGGMGTMGYSIPAGIGAKMCTPDKQVVVVCGDGSFQMSMYELGTIAVNKVPIKILVMRNHYLGLVREHQEKTYEEHYFGVQLYDYPKYAEIAAAYDMEYFHCDSNETLDAELDRFLACDKACLMVCEVDSHNNTK